MQDNRKISIRQDSNNRQKNTKVCQGCRIIELIITTRQDNNNRQNSTNDGQGYKIIEIRVSTRQTPTLKLVKDAG